MIGPTSSRELSPAQKVLLERRLRGSFKSSTPAHPISRRLRSASSPLSFAQQRLWFLDQLQPGSDAYNLPVLLQLRGPLDPVALKKGLNEIVRRHEVLRARFPAEEGNPVQVICPFESLGLPITDLRAEPRDQRRNRAHQLVLESARRPFNLERGPLVRWELVRLDAQEYWLLVTMHHIVSDGWSMALFFKELDSSQALPELPIQYGDFAAWQQEFVGGQMLEEHISYWRQHLAGAPAAIALPSQRHLAAVSQPARALQQTVVLPKSFSETLSASAHGNGVSPFMVLLAAVNGLLARWTRQTDLVVGTVVAGRTRREVENLVGCFMNFLPLRTKLSGDPTLRELLAQIKTTVLESYAHQECPFEKIVEAINPARKASQNPLYNVAFLLQNFPRGYLHGSALEASFIPLEPQAAVVDLRFLAEQTDEGLSLICEYNADLFDAETMALLVKAFGQTVETIVRQPSMRLSALPLDPALATVLAARSGDQPLRLSPTREAIPEKHANHPLIAITSTFTADSLAESLQFWNRKLQLSISSEFAPYNQVFQQLLDPASLLASNRRGMNVVLVRFEDWGQSAAQHELEPQVEQLALALQTASARSAVPWVVCLCPASKAAAVDSGRVAMFARMEEKLAASLSNLRGMHFAGPSELLSLYPVADYDDPHSTQLGHVPYTSEFFVALGTLIVRKFHAVNYPSRKVIVLDCDQTLWTGVCAEDGSAGVKIDAPRRALQVFMRAQREAGMLLCLCSKNTEEDVRAVFQAFPDMPLRPEDFVASRINWRPKSENLRSLAEELQLGLESFILVDDSPLEAAEVEANSPAVLTLVLPEDAQTMPRFLKHAWAFDHLKLTDEDRRRTALYQENRQREQLQARSLSLAEFLAGLELKVRLETPKAAQLQRLAQLTERTNQFNLTTRRRSESEVEQLWRGEQFKFVAVSVSDRFGDYGLVGLIIYQMSAEALKVDTFLLSCRVLGKGVEHQMLAHLGEIALAHGCRSVEIPFIRSARNKPALDFLESLPGPSRKESDGAFDLHLPVEVAAAIVFKPEQASSASTPLSSPAANGSADPSHRHLDSALSRWLALNSHDVGLILREIENQPTHAPARPQNYVPPRTKTEKKLCRIWEQLLRVEQVGVQDDFFELGGSSLLAVRLLAQVRKVTGKSLPLSALFQAPTVESLAPLLGDEPAARSSLAPLQPNGSKPPMILVHGAGGGILWGYANLAAHLGQDQPVYAVEPQPDDGENLSVPDLASRYVADVRALQPAGPYYLGGYCFGGYVAYEMARQLRSQGETVALLALIDSTAPNGSYEKVRWWRPDFLPKFIANLCFWLRDFFRLQPAAQLEFARRQLRVMKKKLLDLSRRSAVKPVHLEEYIDVSQLPDQELNLWRVHLRAGADFVPEPYAGRVTLLRTRSQPMFCSFDPTFGWADLAGEGVEVRAIRGSHENIFTEPDVRLLAQQLQTCLTEAQGSAQPSQPKGTA